MSQFVNDRDIFLETQGNLNLDPRGGRHLFLEVEPKIFRVNAGGVGSPAAATFTVAAINIGGQVTWSAPDGVILRGTGASTRTLSFADMNADTVTIGVSIEYMGEMYEDTATISKLYDGSAVTTYTWIRYGTSAAGANFSDSPAGATHIGLAYNQKQPIESEDPANYQWVLIKGQDGIGVPGAPGADGQTLWTWIKYSDNADGTGLYDLPTDSTVYIGIAANRYSAVESTNKADYVWSRFKGGQGVPGNPGAPGAATFTWIKYASSVTGAALSDSPEGKAYIGFAYNKATPEESNNPADYKWALLRGEDGVGVPGAPGADGVTLYTWIKYADAADGTGLYDTPNDNTIYIGIAVNRTTAAESSTKTDYVWSRFKGAAGVPGKDGGAGPRGNVNIGGTTTGNAWSDTRAAAVLAEAGLGSPRAKDIVALYNPTSSFIATRIFTGDAWITFAQMFDGSLLVKGTVFADAIATDAITTEKLAASAVTAGEIAADAITAEKIAAGAVTARTIAAGAVTARTIAAGAITASSIVVSSDGDNILPDEAFRDLNWWGRPGAVISGPYPAGNFWKTGYCMYLDHNTDGVEKNTVSSPIQLIPGATYRFELQIFVDSAFSGALSVWMHIPNVIWQHLGTGYTGYTFGDGDPVQFFSGSPKGIQNFGITFTVPSVVTLGDNTPYFPSFTQVRVHSKVDAGYIQFGSIKMTRVSDSVLIKDGAITAEKLNVGRSNGSLQGVEINKYGGKVFDSNGVKRFQWGDLDA
jgi:hypothetical protein